MSATNEQALSILAGEVFIAPRTEVEALDDSLSNAQDVITDLNALSFVRLASVTDVQFAVNTSEQQIKEETDDNGVIYQAYVPVAKISGNRFESGDVDGIKALLGLNVLDVAGSPTKRIYGQNLVAKELPKLSIKIVGKNDADGKNNIIYLHDAGLSGDIIQSFVDVVRQGNLTPSPFEFIGNKGGIRLVDAERY